MTLVYRLICYQNSYIIPHVNLHKKKLKTFWFKTDYIKFNAYLCSNPSFIHFVLNKKDRECLLCLLVSFSCWWMSNLILFKTKVEKTLLKGQSCFNELNRRIVHFYKLSSFFFFVHRTEPNFSKFLYKFSLDIFASRRNSPKVLTDIPCSFCFKVYLNA